MRPHHLILPATLLLASTVGAQNMPYPPADTAPITSVEVTAPAKLQRIKSHEAEKIRGTYEMSNGWFLRVQAAPRHIDAVIDGRSPLRLLPVAPYRFASGDGNVTMDFNRGSTGDDMEMSYIPEGRVAQRVVLSSRLAQR